MVERHRERLQLTMDPTWRDRAAKMAAERGLSLSVYLEQLVHAEVERLAKAKKEASRGK